SATTPHLSFAVDRPRRSYLAVSVSFLGAGSVRISARARGDAARGRPEKIRTLWFAALSDSNAAGWRALLDVSPRQPFARQHYLHWSRHDRAEAARLDARLLQRDAHWLHFSWIRACQHSQHHRCMPA